MNTPREIRARVRDKHIDVKVEDRQHLRTTPRRSKLASDEERAHARVSRATFANLDHTQQEAVPRAEHFRRQRRSDQGAGISDSWESAGRGWVMVRGRGVSGRKKRGTRDRADEERVGRAGTLSEECKTGRGWRASWQPDQSMPTRIKI